VDGLGLWLLAGRGRHGTVAGYKGEAGLGAEDGRGDLRGEWVEKDGGVEVFFQEGWVLLDVALMV